VTCPICGGAAEVIDLRTKQRSHDCEVVGRRIYWSGAVFANFKFFADVV
jgi:hypothetical protein